jgi:cell division protein FtsW
MVSVVALAAIGILMVYSSSGVAWMLAMGDAFAIVGPQAFWAVLGAVVMVVFMRLDYRYLRFVSVAGYLVALVLLVLVLLPTAIGPIVPIVEGGSRRWLEIGMLPRMHPAEIAKLALLIYLAHWLARKGTASGSLTNGFVPFLLLTLPVLGLVLLRTWARWACSRSWPSPCSSSPAAASSSSRLSCRSGSPASCTQSPRATTRWPA